MGVCGLLNDEDYIYFITYKSKSHINTCFTQGQCEDAQRQNALRVRMNRKSNLNVFYLLLLLFFNPEWLHVSERNKGERLM